MKNRKCSKCKNRKELLEFKLNTMTDHYSRHCLVCIAFNFKKEYDKQYFQKYYQENIKYLIEYQKQYNIDNAEKLKERDRLYYEKNKDKIRNKIDEYVEKNKEIIKEKQKIYYANNREKIIKNSVKNKKERRKKDPAFRLMENCSTHIRKFIKKDGLSVSTFFEFSKENFKKHIENLFEPWMNWDNYGNYKISRWDDNDLSTWKWQLDHITPVSSFKFSSKDDQEFKDCWNLSNLRPYSAKQNVIDNDRGFRISQKY